MLPSQTTHTRRPRPWSLLSLAALGCGALPVSASSTPSAAFLQNTGDKANRVDILFVGDGYTAAEMSTYADHIDAVLDHMFDTGGINAGVTNPYARYQNFFNIIRVDAQSNESGVDRYDHVTNQPIELVDTVFKGALGRTAPQSLTIDYLFAAPPIISAALAPLGYTYTAFQGSDTDWQFAAVNTTYYGGEASSYATFSAGHADAAELALHEGGHWNHDLGDEYGGNPAPFPFIANEVNLDLDHTGDDWAHWLGYLDPQTGPVAAYPGGRGYDTGVYHPSPDSKMRILGAAFDPVAREKIILDIYALVDPIDDHLDNNPTYNESDDLWIDVVDTDVLMIEWLVNGQAIAGQSSETLDLSAVISQLGPGSHTITARAYDSILDHNFSDNNDPDPLDLVRRDLDQLEQSVAFSVDIAYLPGDTDFDGDIDQHDLNTILQHYNTAVPPGDAANGDVTGDGEVGIEDLDLALARWTGETLPLLVPEPIAALPLLILTFLHRPRSRS
ncbi:MAG: M64 family metallopeptidase [Phycisphaeraceae bacterium]